MAIGTYLEQKIQAAEPLELICIAYQQAIQAIREAKAFLLAGNIRARANKISLAHGILAELYRALDFQAGDGALARELGRLYAYMMQRLIDANMQQSEAALSEVESLLGSLYESWTAVSSQTGKPAATSHAWSAPEEVTSDSAQYSYSF